MLIGCFFSILWFHFIAGKSVIVQDEKMTTTSQTATVTANVPPSRNENVNVKPEMDEKLASLSSKRDASWPSVLFYIHLNILGLYGVMVLFTNAYLTTVIFTTFLSFIGIIGVTCGAHRLWAHQTYEANTFLRLFLMLCQTMAGQVNMKKIQLKKSIPYSQQRQIIESYTLEMEMNRARTLILLVLFLSDFHKRQLK